MAIKQLTKNEFENFVRNHQIGNFYQSNNYAELMKKNGYTTEFIGLVDQNNNIKAASLILIKELSKLFKYGYAPKGFIIDYTNKKLLEEFTEQIIDYYQKKRLIFIKINPEIAIAEINPHTYKKETNCNIDIKNHLYDLGYVKLKDNLYFESKMPKYNGIVNLKNFDLKNLHKNTRNKINRCIEKGLKFEKGDKKQIDILYNFIKKKKDKDISYYKDYYNIFSKDKSIDLFLVSIDTNTFLENAKNAYEKELIENAEVANILMDKKTEKKLNIKMNSDKKLLAYKNDLLEAQARIKNGKKIYIAGALVVKYKNRVNIVISGYDTKYKKFNPNYFLHYQILEYYKNDYTFADLNGLTGIFNEENPYYGLNRFKLGFKPKIYEFIGEYDLIINNLVYKSMLKRGYLAKKFNKKEVKF